MGRSRPPTVTIAHKSNNKVTKPNRMPFAHTNFPPTAHKNQISDYLGNSNLIDSNMF